MLLRDFHPALQFWQASDNSTFQTKLLIDASATSSRHLTSHISYICYCWQDGVHDRRHTGRH